MRALSGLTWAYERQREHRAIRWFSCHVVRIFCEVMSHSAINRSVDKVSALRGSIDTRESITNLGQVANGGREHFQTKWSCDPMYGKVNKRSKTTCFATFSTTISSDMVRHI